MDVITTDAYIAASSLVLTNDVKQTVVAKAYGYAT
jgi:hypothetical protein